MKFNKLSKIQETDLPMLITNPPTNIIGQSWSVTGKTAAFFCLILSRVDSSKTYPQARCLSITFELVLKTVKVLEKIG